MNPTYPRQLFYELHSVDAPGDSVSRRFCRRHLIDSSGVSLITALMALLVLSALGLGILSLNRMEQFVSINMMDSTAALYIAEAGIQRAVRAVRDDTDASVQTADPTQNGFHGSPSVDADSAAAVTGGADASVLNEQNATDYNGSACRLESVGRGGGGGSGWGEPGLPGTPGDTAAVSVSDYLQQVNLKGSRLKAIVIGCRYRRGAYSGSGTFNIGYELSGSPGPTSATWSLPSSWTTQYLDITSDRSWGWGDLNNLALTAEVVADAGESGGAGGWGGGGGGSGADNYYDADVDYLFCRITHEIDASTEPWYSTFRNLDDDGTPKTVNVALGRGAVERMPVYDEAGKVHINYATADLMESLFEKCGISSPDAASLAGQIVSYRGSTLFATVSQIKQVAGMTDEYFDLIKDYVTDYSWENTAVERPAGTRAPVNINTAPRIVLEALFDPVPGITAFEAQDLADDILSFRNSTPFVCIHTSDPTVTSSFEYFLRTVCTYLTTQQRTDILENADGSGEDDWDNDSVPDTVTTSNVTTTEICFFSKRFSVHSAASIQGRSTRTVKRVFEDFDEDGDGIFTIPAHTSLNFWQDTSVD